MLEPQQLHPQLRDYLQALGSELDELAPDRRAALEQIADYIKAQHAAGEPARLLFICTHNSRRSHMGQLWAATAAAYFGVPGIETYSGGTEATAFNPRAVAAMRRAGFSIDPEQPSDENPRYEVRFGPETDAMLAFSKAWQDPPNPSEGFAAIMTCSEADAACPFVRGASLRVSLPYDDPKAADDTPEEAQRYDERARQIAVEMLYLARLLTTDQPGI